jgi:Fe2+ transport system protein FeoA
MESGKTGKIVEIQGGSEFIRRLASMGVRLNLKVKKVGGQLFKGPVVLKVGRTTLAIGYEMACKIILEVE